MGFVKTYNTITVTTSFQTLFDITSDRHFALWLFLQNLTGVGDNVEIKISVMDDQGGAVQSYIDETKANPLTTNAWWSGYVTTARYKAEVKRSASGVDRSINWTRYEAT